MHENAIGGKEPMLSLRHRKLPLVLTLGVCFVIACKTHVPTTTTGNDDGLNKPGNQTTTTTSAESPAATSSGTETTGAATDPGNVQSNGGGADLGTTERGPSLDPGQTGKTPPGGLVIGSDFPMPPPPTRPDLNDMGMHDPPTNTPPARLSETRGARDGGAPPPAPKPKSKAVMP